MIINKCNSKILFIMFVFINYLILEAIIYFKIIFKNNKSLNKEYIEILLIYICFTNPLCLKMD